MGIWIVSIWSWKRKIPRDYGVSVDFPRENTLGEIKTDENREDPPTRGFVFSNRNPLRMITAKRREGIYNKDRGVVPRNPGQILARPHREQNSEQKIQQHLEQSLLLFLGAIWSVLSRSLCVLHMLATLLSVCGLSFSANMPTLQLLSLCITSALDTHWDYVSHSQLKILEK